MTAAIAALVLVLASCGTSGRTLRDPAPGATAPPRKTSTTAGAAATQALTGALSITSPSWSPGGEIPIEYTCDGADTSPPLTISGAPDDTVELVLVVRDPDAGGLLHWAVAGISPGSPSFPAGDVSPDAVVLPGGRGDNAWFGPCPPEGTVHTYEFTLHALPAPSGLGIGSSEQDLDDAVAAATSVAVLTGTYTRPS